MTAGSVAVSSLNNLAQVSKETVMNKPQTRETHGDHDPDGHIYRRRMREQKFEEIANSAVLKIFQYTITGVAIPLIGWSLSTVLDRLKTIEESINKATLQAATFELRTQTLERASIEQAALNKLTTEQLVRHEYYIKRLEELKQDKGAK
jgi:hypothetical protein